MPRYKEPIEEPGTWIFRDIPRALMRRAKAAAAIQGKTVKGLAIELMEKLFEGDGEARGFAEGEVT